MKQVTVELDDSIHAGLKDRAKSNLRKIGAQLLFEALAYISGSDTPAPKLAKKASVKNRKSAARANG